MRKSNQILLALGLYLTVVLIFIIGLLFLASHLMINYGAVKERDGKACVEPYAMSKWEQTIELVNTGADLQKQQIEEFKKIFDQQIKKKEAEVKYWKDAYLWLKKQQQDPKEEIKE